MKSCAYRLHHIRSDRREIDISECGGNLIERNLSQIRNRGRETRNAFPGDTCKRVDKRHDSVNSAQCEVDFREINSRYRIRERIEICAQRVENPKLVDDRFIDTLKIRKKLLNTRGRRSGLLDVGEICVAQSTGYRHQFRGERNHLSGELRQIELSVHESVLGKAVGELG